MCLTLSKADTLSVACGKICILLVNGAIVRWMGLNQDKAQRLPFLLKLIRALWIMVSCMSFVTATMIWGYSRLSAGLSLVVANNYVLQHDLWRQSLFQQNTGSGSIVFC